MRAVVVMYDSLNRRMLPPYGAQGVHAPNFTRLARHTVAFDNCYAGSMPCMPARRELHTGRYNFLHRSWGPIEPFDDSVFELLGRDGIHTHLATDHQHYWEDGGATYHNRYTTYEFFRGQEGDRWKGVVGGVEPPATLNSDNFLTRQDWVNRQYLTDESSHSQTLTFDAGLEFIETNLDADRWLVQIETFDPHEPFFSYDRYRELYGSAQPDRPVFDWPSYRRVVETDDEVEQARREYLALLSMCDRSLGRVLDAFDRHALWDDTMLVVCTDHGFLLGERGWWGKSVQPWFNETIHTPLFVWDPRSGTRGVHADELVQTIDLGPTLLEFFGLPLMADMQGRPLRDLVARADVERDHRLERDVPAVRRGALFGAHGGHVNVTDGRYVYMRACVDEGNGPLFEYTLMPTHMRSRFEPSELLDAELSEPFSFTKGVHPLKVAARPMGNPFWHGTLLFDLERDPLQLEPTRDDALELRMAQLLADLMRENDAPPEQFVRVGLPIDGPVTREHLQVERQWEQTRLARTPAARRCDLPEDAIIARLPIGQVLEDTRLAAALPHDLVTLLRTAVRMSASTTLLEALAHRPGAGLETAQQVEAALRAALDDQPSLVGRTARMERTS
jgi:arylsulfatase A-like enzyme